MDVREKHVVQKVSKKEKSICQNCIHHNLCIAENNQPCFECNRFMDANGVTVQEWISVKDKLPPYNLDVLVYRPNMAMKILVDNYEGYYGEDDDEWYEGWAKHGTDIHGKPVITYWQYLPQPPKGE